MEPVLALPHYLHVLLPQQLVSVSKIPPFFSCISPCISGLVLSGLAIAKAAFIYQPMGKTHIHSVQKDHPTAAHGKVAEPCFATVPQAHKCDLQTGRSWEFSRTHGMQESIPHKVPQLMNPVSRVPKMFLSDVAKVLQSPLGTCTAWRSVLYLVEATASTQP